MTHPLQKQSLNITPTIRKGKAVFKMTAKGVPLKLGKYMVLAEKIRDLIADKKTALCSIQTFKNTSCSNETQICEKTLYDYLADGVIPEISITNLSNKGKKYNGDNTRKPKFSRVGCMIRSIANSPEHINNCSEGGHREIDTVKSCASSTENAH